ncbi:hypothetical protein FRC10_010741 [Ceratobasidium sp. 414]|nr:hypothetical protein FRC10_010741 [Ceratobasidium sp. 414]
MATISIASDGGTDTRSNSPMPPTFHSTPAHTGQPAAVHNLDEDEDKGDKEEEEEEEEEEEVTAGMAYSLTDVQRAWIQDKQYPLFLQNRRNRGSRSGANGKTFVFKTAMPSFIKHWHSGWDQNTRGTFLPAIQRVIYNLFNNLARKDPYAQSLKNTAPSTSTGHHKKINPENEWAREHPEQVEGEMIR